jgi:hypothetical protein
MAISPIGLLLPQKEEILSPGTKVKTNDDIWWDEDSGCKYGIIEHHIPWEQLIKEDLRWLKHKEKYKEKSNYMIKLENGHYVCLFREEFEVLT